MFDNMNLDDLAKQFEETIDQYRYGSSVFQAMSNPRVLESFHEHVKEILNVTTTAGTSLACRGWFFSIRLPLREMVIIRSLPGKSNEEVDEAMSKIYNSNISSIQEELCVRFPNRSELIRETFRAHEHEWYNLSVLGFFSLADGIYIDLSGVKKSVYSKKRGTDEPLSKNFIDQMNLEESMLMYLELLRTETALNVAKGKRDPDLLNRHAVMHGTSTDYGTEINSLKALSYLYSVWTNIEAAKTSKLNKEDQK